MVMSRARTRRKQQCNPVCVLLSASLLCVAHVNNGEYMLLPVWFFYCEMVFHLSVFEEITLAELLLLLVLSAGLGLLAYGVFLLIPNIRVRRILSAVLMAASAVLYLSGYFLYLQFHTLFDLHTILFTVRDAVNGFGGETTAIMESAAGVRQLLLYLPFPIGYLVWSLFSKREAPAVSPRRKWIALALSAAAFLAAFGIKHADEDCAEVFYGTRFSFTRSVERQGVVCGLLDEIKDALLGNEARNAQYGREEGPILIDPDTQNVLDLPLSDASADEDYARTNAYVASRTPTVKNDYTGRFAGKNLILICAESFSGYVIDEETTPMLYRMQHQGFFFSDFYQPFSASTAGGEYQLLTGLLPMAGTASLDTISEYHNCMTLGSLLSEEGYYGQMFHNGDSGYYNREVTHNSLGYSEPFLAYGSGLEKRVSEEEQSSDRAMFLGTLPLYADQEPFNIYYMTISGHLPYWTGSNVFADRNRDRVTDTQGLSEETVNYIAANLELEDAVSALVEGLAEAGVLENTVIVICPDHYPYGINNGQDYENLPYIEELYGHQVTNAFERDESCLIIWTPELEEEVPVEISEPCSSLDVLPTLLNLFGLPYDSRLLPGRDVFSDTPALVFNTTADWKTSLGIYINETETFLPAEGVFLEDLPKDYVDDLCRDVQNRIEYSRFCTFHDYLGYLFEEKDSEN